MAFELGCPLGDRFHGVRDFSNQFLPPLWTTLTSWQKRYDAATSHAGYRPTCNGTDHSMRHCSNKFINASGILNPQLSVLNDDDSAFHTCLQRMRSYRASQSQHTSSRKGQSVRSNGRYTGRRNDRNTSQGGHYGHHVHSEATERSPRTRVTTATMPAV